MITRSTVILAAHRVLLRRAAGRLAPFWALCYRALAWAWVTYLTWGEHGAASYALGSMASDELLPGLSDVDVALVLRADPVGPGRASERVTARSLRVRRRFPRSGALLGHPFVFERDDLVETVDCSTFTFGLDAPRATPAVYFGERAVQDKMCLLERPGLYGAAADWRLIRGRDQRPPERSCDAQLRRITAWLELCAWWQWVFPACADPHRPSTASLCVKLVAEPARIWLWLAHGERVRGREEALTHALRRLPEEQQSLRAALRLLRALPDSPAAPLDEVLTALVRLSRRIARLIASEVGPEGFTHVLLAGADPAELILAHGRWHVVDSLAAGQAPDVLPLCDWRSLSCPRLPDECFAPLAEDPCDPAVLAAATTSQDYGPYPALEADGLMLFPGARSRTGLRAVKCPVTDPVSFALLERQPYAAFPNVAGWSAQDTAARALAEHRAWLDAEPRSGSADAEGLTLAMLITAARVALFAESLHDADVPELPLTLTETARRLAARSTAARDVAEHALGCYKEFAVFRTPPSSSTLDAMRELVRRLPAYAVRDQIRSATRVSARR